MVRILDEWKSEGNVCYIVKYEQRSWIKPMPCLSHLSVFLKKNNIWVLLDQDSVSLKSDLATAVVHEAGCYYSRC